MNCLVIGILSQQLRHHSIQQLCGKPYFLVVWLIHKLPIYVPRTSSDVICSSMPIRQFHSQIKITSCHFYDNKNPSNWTPVSLSFQTPRCRCATCRSTTWATGTMLHPRSSMGNWSLQFTRSGFQIPTRHGPNRYPQLKTRWRTYCHLTYLGYCSFTGSSNNSYAKLNINHGTFKLYYLYWVLHWLIQGPCFETMRMKKRLLNGRSTLCQHLVLTCSEETLCQWFAVPLLIAWNGSFVNGSLPR